MDVAVHQTVADVVILKSHQILCLLEICHSMQVKILSPKYSKGAKKFESLRIGIQESQEG